MFKKMNEIIDVNIDTDLQCFSEHTKGGCYASQNIQTGDAMLLRAYKRGMQCFSEHTKGGCCTSQNKTSGAESVKYPS
jgi:hypothetical protein